LAKIGNNSLHEANPVDRVVTVDVYRDNIPLLDWDVLQARFKACQQIPLTEAERDKLAAFNALADQFVAADK